MGRRVLVTEPVHEDALTLLRAHEFEVIGPAVDRGAVLETADALLVRTRKLTADEVTQFALISKHGVGVDNIPMDAAAAAGVAVMNTPGANAGAVAEQALMLMLALSRNLDGQRAAVPGDPAPQVRGLEGRRLLIIGFGASGKRVAALAKALGMAVTVFSRDLKEARNLGYPVAPDFSRALAHAEIVSLHCPLTPQTANMLDGAALALLPQGALVVNCARGGLIDEAALIAALNSGHLGGAGLDVSQVEPLPLDAPLRAAPRVILTPHAATLSDGAFRRMGMMAAQNILDFFAGKPAESHTLLPKD
ncbi:NAD(P)-dependent oxidoreductase [Pseudorhodobacter ferrugineus]|uniref:NAD(P)-dependent oxidoreductase n=1 Tax=Pseudorhodobacter ferrugineus TaxID=77008 RepID=UPI0003B33973|nr:NAD(P)-dependent oxidoreductase [Pseudorhodobacter ferrugineus]